MVVSSRLEMVDARRFGVRPERLFHIPMGIDLAACPAARHDADGPLRLLFVGRIARVRRVEWILQAVHQLPLDWTLTLVGGEEKTSSVTRGGYLPQLKKLAMDLGIQDKVSFEGPQPQEALSAYYQNADIFIYPSLYENFGQPILEAAAHGLPLVATPVGVAAELIEPGETGFLIRNDPASITAAVHQLKDSGIRQKAATALRRKIELEFGWDPIMQRYLDLYRSLV